MAYEEIVTTPIVDGHQIYFGTCATAAGTAAKVATLENKKGFKLAAGTVVAIKFTYNNSAANPTLNVESTGAKSLKQYGTTAISTANETSGWYAGAVVIFIYDGTNWVRDQGFNTNTSYYNLCVYTTTAAATAAKVGTTTKFKLEAGKHFQFMNYYDNTAKSALTLNIASTGAKPIYINGTASSATNYTLPYGLYLVYYDGTNYYFDTTGKIKANSFDGCGLSIKDTSDIIFPNANGILIHMLVRLVMVLETLLALLVIQILIYRLLNQMIIKERVFLD